MSRSAVGGGRYRDRVPAPAPTAIPAAPAAALGEPGWESSEHGRSQWRADPAQDRVLALPPGAHAAVIGAPGTGKSSTLIRLVEQRLRAAAASADPGSLGLPVLALTASRHAATSLRDALAASAALVTDGALARTINSLAFEIVGYVRSLTRAPAPVLLTGPEQDTIIADLLAGDLADGTGPEWPPHIGPSVRERREFRTALRDFMMRATTAWIEPDTIRRLGAQHGRPEWIACGDFIDEYRRSTALFRSAHLDTASLVAFAAAAVQRGAIPPFLERTRMIVVDDAQELADGEIDLLRALAQAGVQIVAFGDPDIAAGAYRSGRPEFLGTLGARLGVPQAEQIVLGTEYRHGAAIRECVQSITARIGTAAAGQQRLTTIAAPRVESGPAVEHRPDHTRLEPVLHLQAPTRGALVGAVARVLRERHLYDGVPWERMAVITRSGSAIPDLIRSLSGSEVPATAGSVGAHPRTDAVVGSLVDVASLALGLIELDPRLSVRLLLGSLGGLDALALRRLRLALRTEELAAGGSRSADELLVEALAGPNRFVTIDASFARRAGRCASNLAAARADAAAGASAEALLWGIWDRSGLAGSLREQSNAGGSLGAEADSHLDAVVGIFAAARRSAERDPDALARAFFDEYLGSDLPEDAIAPHHGRDRVRVVTPAATVGLDFDVVAVLGLQDGVWPNTRIRGTLLDPDGLVLAAQDVARTPDDERAAVVQDELRLFARAVSRACAQVVVGTIASDDEQPSPFARLVPSPPTGVSGGQPLSLRGMAGTLRRRLLLSGDPHAAAALARLAEERVPGADPADWYGVLEQSTDAPLIDVTEDRVSVSPSQIDAFERCPLHWFLNKYGASAPTSAMGIGTIIHEAMERATEFDVDSLWAFVDRRWSELRFESPWIADRERLRARRMIEGLSDYLITAARDGRTVLGAETRFSLRAGAAELHGSIDRIEQRADGTVSVVDLKTGATMPSIGSMDSHAQLGAYQYAVHSGAIESVPSDVVISDARLVFVQLSNRGQRFNERTQHRLDGERIEAFAERLHTVAVGMADRTFVAQVEEHCTAEHFGGPCAIHVVGELTW